MNTSTYICVLAVLGKCSMCKAFYVRWLVGGFDIRSLSTASLRDTSTVGLVVCSPMIPDMS